eukprot:1156047-Pelagomonas_calceolata.AAC.5
MFQPRQRKELGGKRQGTSKVRKSSSLCLEKRALEFMLSKKFTCPLRFHTGGNCHTHEAAPGQAGSTRYHEAASGLKRSTRITRLPQD